MAMLENRRIISTQLPDGEVLSDGRTVWVNLKGQCVARFCPLSREYMGVWQGTVDAHPHDFKDHPETIPLSYLTFVGQVQYRYGVTVEEKHRPTYVLG